MSESELTGMDKLIWEAMEESFPEVAEECVKLIGGKMCIVTKDECSLGNCPKLL